MYRWLLNHDPCKRPNSTEILQSQFIPPPKLKDTELHEMVRNTLSNSKSKNYKHLIAACFGQVSVYCLFFTCNVHSSLSRKSSINLLNQFLSL